MILGGGPAGNTAATVAATLGAEVTLIERDVIGGAAHLLDCVPSKAMIATGGALASLRRGRTMGLVADGSLDVVALRERVSEIEERLRRSVHDLLASQGVRMIAGTGRFVDSSTVEVTTATGPETVTGDVFLIATGSRSRVPDWAAVDGERVLLTRDAYPPPEIPAHLCVIGSGVTGVEFTHMFSAVGSEVSLVVSRQQVLPQKDPEVAAVLEDEFLTRGVHLLKGARAQSAVRDGDVVHVQCNDGRHVEASHVVLAIGSVPNTDDLGLDAAGVVTDANGYITINHNCITTVPNYDVAMASGLTWAIDQFKSAKVGYIYQEGPFGDLIGAGVKKALAAKGILGGLPVSRLMPDAGLDDLLVIANTEVNTDEDRAALLAGLKSVL